MRKIHEKAIRAFLGKESMKSARDTVAGGCWFYHGNLIAKLTEEGVMINWCGWFGAPSTTQRIYGLCDYINAVRPNKADGWIKVA